MLIGRDGGLSTPCHSCGFACQHRVQKTFLGPGYLCSDDALTGGLIMAFTGKSVYIYIYIYIYTNVTRYAGNNTDLSSDSNILNALMVNIM